MIKSYLNIFVPVTVIAVILAVLNILLYFHPGLAASRQTFIYPLPVVYGFFLLLSIIILGILIKVSEKNEQQIGFAFLLLTGVKMALSYFMVSPILGKAEPDATEKINFFVVFLIFLVIEAYYTARLLNKKQ